MKSAHQIDIHHKLDLLNLLLVELLRHKHAVVANEHINGPSFLHRARHRLRVPHIGSEGVGLHARGEADGIARLVEASGVSGEDGDSGAFRRNLESEGEADAA